MSGRRVGFHKFSKPIIKAPTQRLAGFPARLIRPLHAVRSARVMRLNPIRRPHGFINSRYFFKGSDL